MRVRNIRVDWPHGTRFSLDVFGKAYDVRMRLIGENFAVAGAGALAAALEAGRPLAFALEALEGLPPTRGRMRPIALPSGAFILSDEYKATPQTIEAGLRVLSDLPARKRWVVIGDLHNLPTSDHARHYADIGAAIARVADGILVIGDKLAAYERGLPGAGSQPVTHAVADVFSAAAWLRAHLGEGDVVYLKGIEDRAFARVSLLLQDKDVRCDVARCGVPHQGCEDCALLALSPGGRGRRGSA
jgi:UDP-N-acetylmuramyl pentapeptide synthase